MLRWGATAACTVSDSRAAPIERGSGSPASPMRKSVRSMSWGAGASIAIDGRRQFAEPAASNSARNRLRAVSYGSPYRLETLQTLSSFQASWLSGSPCILVS